jgi:hypothetical protein
MSWEPNLFDFFAIVWKLTASLAEIAYYKRVLMVAKPLCEARFPDQPGIVRFVLATTFIAHNAFFLGAIWI